MMKFYLTTPIYYPNARPHVGSAYTTIVCDAVARYKRMCGYDVAFLTGTDEHGEKLARAAAAEGKSPRRFVEEKRGLFVTLWEKLGMPVSVYPEGGTDALRFVYTDHPEHVTSVQRLLRRARENGYIYRRRYEGRYCVSDERYVSDSTDPVNCDICGRPAELISEENYFFKLSAFEKPLLELYQSRPGRTEFVQPDYRKNEVMSFAKSGLRDISVSRKRLTWGIPWPDDPEQVFYVWYDALTSYMTGIGYAQGENGSAEFQKYWRNQPGESEIVHMIGKDILRFHAVYWPAFIMAAYPNQPEMLPTTIFAHGWIYYEQDKMSKSKGNVVYPEPIIDTLDSFGAPGNDALRYYLLREATFGQDMSFSYGGLIQRYNSDLANDLGNLASRTVKMIGDYFGGQVPKRDDGFDHSDNRTSTLKARAQTDARDYLEWFDHYHISRALDLAWELTSEANKYLVLHSPWSDFKRIRGTIVFPGMVYADGSNIVDPEAQRIRRTIASVLYTAADTLRMIAALICPILPRSAERLWKQLGCEGELKSQRVDQLKWGDLKPGTRVGKPEPIFPRLDKAKTLAKLHELAEADYERDRPKGATVTVPSEIPPSLPPAPGPAGSAPSLGQKISIEDFAKVEMRVGEVKTAERVEGATKLLKLMVDIGTEVRQVVAGIAEQYEPQQLLGMKVVLVANLQPRKLRGVESNGMILAATVGPEGRPVLVTFKEDVPKGARLK